MGLGFTEFVILAVAVAVVGPLVWLIGRRRWLARLGGTFDCSVRLSKTTPGAGWALGVARYRGETLEWFRFFSLSVKPTITFHRGETVVVSQREPSRIEADQLLANERIVTLDVGLGTYWEAALVPESLTALLSWLESAPPGLKYRTPAV